MASKNSKKVNNKEKKRKYELEKDRTWKVVETFDSVYLNCLETKFESRRKRKEDVKIYRMCSIWRSMRDRKWDRNWQNVSEFVGLKV